MILPWSSHFEAAAGLAPQLAPSVLLRGVESPSSILVWVPTGKLRPFTYDSVGTGFTREEDHGQLHQQKVFCSSSLPGLHRCPAPAGLFFHYQWQCYDQFAQNSPTPCRLSTFFTFRSRTLVGSGCQKHCDLRHQVRVDLTHAVSLPLNSKGF